MFVGACILALFAAIVGLPGGLSVAYADGMGPEPPNNPPPGDTTWTATDADLADPQNKTVNTDPKQDVSLWHIAQLIVLGVI